MQLHISIRKWPFNLQLQYYLNIFCQILDCLSQTVRSVIIRNSSNFPKPTIKGKYDLKLASQNSSIKTQVYGACFPKVKVSQSSPWSRKPQKLCSKTFPSRREVVGANSSTEWMLFQIQERIVYNSERQKEQS